MGVKKMFKERGMSSERFIAKRSRAAGGFSLDTEALARFEDIIDLSIGDTNLTTDERIINAAHRDALLGCTHYGNPMGDPELVSALIESRKEDYGEELESGNILITASAGVGLSLALFALLDPGDETIVFSPYYPNYAPSISLAGGALKEVPLYERENFAFSKERLLAAVSEKTKVILFNNPVNPTGMLYGQDVYKIIAEVAEEKDLAVIADEIYTAYVYSGSFRPFRLYPGMKERTVTITSFSKDYQMTGWRIGAAMGEREIIEAMFHVNEPVSYTTSSVSQRAAIEALKLRKEICADYRREFGERVRYAAERIKNIPWLTLIEPEGTFYVFPGIEKTGLSSKEFCGRLLEEAHVLVSPGSAFGSSGEGHVRIAVSCAGMDKLKEAFDRIEKLNF